MFQRLFQTFTIMVKGTGPPVVTERLVNVTGSSSTDHITSNDTLTGSGDANALVTFKEGSTTLGTTTAAANGSWSFTPSGLADGTHTIVASETDSAGNTGTTSLSFTLDTTAPSLTAVANQTDEATSASGALATFAATASDAVDGTDAVIFTDGNTVVHSGDTFSLGVHTITASMHDAAGNASSETFTITVQDTTAPVVTERLVSDTGSSSTDHITSNDTLTGSGDANALVTFTEGSTILGTTTAAANGSWSFTPSGLADGTHAIVASETDTAGNTGTTSLSFTLDTTAPAVTERLLSDTGSSSTDHITSNDTLTGSGDATPSWRARPTVPAIPAPPRSASPSTPRHRW
jgi:hypothetical protein